MGGIEELAALRAEALRGRDPTCADETLSHLLRIAAEGHVRRYLEVGAGEGLTTAALLLSSGAEATAIELDPLRAERARALFGRFGLASRVHLAEGDAGEILPLLEGEYDLIFLDGPKAQYLRYLPDLKRLLRRGGTLLSDDVFLFGRDAEPPRKRRSLALHLRAYLDALCSDQDFRTELYGYGKGLAVSVKRA